MDEERDSRVDDGLEWNNSDKNSKKKVLSGKLRQPVREGMLLGEDESMELAEGIKDLVKRRDVVPMQNTFSHDVCVLDVKFEFIFGLGCLLFAGTLEDGFITHHGEIEEMETELAVRSEGVLQLNSEVVELITV